MPDPPELFLIRHAQTEWSEARRHTGRTDLPLTERGRSNALRVGRRLAGRRFARIFSSPLQRALETCQLAGFGDRVELRESLVEWDYGEYEGRTTADIRRERPGWSLWRDAVPGGESAEAVARRVDGIVAELRTLEGDALLFAHGHVLRVLAARWLGLPGAAGGSLALDTAAISALGFDRETPVLRLWNDTGSLPRGLSDSG